MARVSERIASLLLAAEEAGLPVIPVESQQLWRVRLSDLRRPTQRLGLCGLYGDECVLAVAHRLTRRGYRAVILEDACLWSWPPNAEDHDPALDQIPRARALSAFPSLSDRPEWQGGLPCIAIEEVDR